MFYSKKIFENLGFNSRDDLETFLNREDVINLIGKNYDHYKTLWLYHYDKKVEKKSPEKVQGRFNWLGLLAPFAWLAYRKMYAVLIAVCSVILAVSLIETYMGTEPDISNKIANMAGLILAMTGKQFYFSHVVQSVKKMDKMTSTDKARFLSRNGGVSVLWAWLATPVFLVVLIISIEAVYMLTGEAQDPSSYITSPAQVY